MTGKTPFFLLAGMIAGAAYAAPPVLLDDFEENLDQNWKGIGAYWRETGTAASGKKALQRVLYAGTPANSKPTILQAQKLYPVPQGEFGFSIQCSGGDIDGSGIRQLLILEFYDANGKLLPAPNNKVQFDLSSTRSAYTQTISKVTAPAGAVQFKPILGVQINKPITKTAYTRFDDFKIGDWENFEAASVALNSLDTSFEYQGNGWDLNKSWRINGGARDGKTAIDYWSPAGGSPRGSHAVLSSKIPLNVEGGETYRLSGYISSSDTTRALRLSVEVTFRDKDGKVVGTDGTRPSIPGNVRWEEVSKLVTAPADAVTADIALRSTTVKDLNKQFRSRFDYIRMPRWSDEKKLAEPKGPAPKPIKMEDPDSGKVTSGNLGIGKFYQASRKPQGEYSDDYPNEWTLGSRLTDGKSGNGTKFDKSLHVGWRGVDPVSVTVDLGRVQTLEEVSFGGFEENESHFAAPAGLSITVSTDKETWQDWGKWQYNEKARQNGYYQYSLKGAAAKARYVQLTFTPDQAKNYGLLMLNEITLNGKIKNTWKYVPANGAYHGAFPPTYGFKEPLRAGRKKALALPIYEKLVGKKLSMVLWYQGMAPERGFAELQELRLHDMAEDYYGQRFMSLGWLPGAGVTLQEIICGNLDEYFTDYFRDSIDEVKTYGDKTPIWFRPMNEFNSGWVSWGLDPDNFRLAWRRMYNIAEQVGAAEHHIFVWSPNHRSYPDVEWNKMEHYYPGDQYVDWVGLSCYPPSPQYTKTEDARYPYGRVEEINQKYGAIKPMMIAEGGYDSTDKISRLRWVQEWFGFQQKVPTFKAMIWENHGTRVIQDGEDALEAYRKLVQDPYWISETYCGE